MKWKVSRVYLVFSTITLTLHLYKMGDIHFTSFRGSKEGIKESKEQSEDLHGDQVLVKITHSGLCGTDLHYRSADQVLGHEGVGTVERTGPAVRDLKKYGPLHFPSSGLR